MFQKAFSLIELMVVIAVVALLSAVAVPSYKDYMIKTKVSSVMSYLEFFKMKQLEYYNSNGSFTDAATLGMESSQPYFVNLANENVDYFVLNHQCSSQRGEVGVSIDAAATGLPGPLYFYLAIENENDILVTRCFTHPNTSLTAIASRDYVPANCTTLQEPSAQNCP